MVEPCHALLYIGALSPPPFSERVAEPKVEGCAPVLLGTILYFEVEGIDFIIQLANRVAIESMYVWECPTYVIRGRD